MVSQDVSGVICDECHNETFRIAEREKTITVKVKVCPYCAFKLDATKESKVAIEVNAILGKAERRIAIREASHEWAKGLDGLRVVAHYNVWDGFGTLLETCSIKGIAYRLPDTSGGWGAVKVYLDPRECVRVSSTCHCTGFCKYKKRSMWEAKDICCDNMTCKERLLVLDGYRWGEAVYKEQDRYFIVATWASRNEVAVDYQGEG